MERLALVKQECENHMGLFGFWLNEIRHAALVQLANDIPKDSRIAKLRVYAALIQTNLKEIT
jgi:hypothetical protein